MYNKTRGISLHHILSHRVICYSYVVSSYCMMFLHSIMLYNVISLTSHPCYITFCHIKKYGMLHVVFCYVLLLCDVFTFSYIMQCYFISHHVISRHVTSHFITKSNMLHVVFCYVLLVCDVFTISYATQCHFMSHHVISCHIMSCFIT